MDFLNMFFSQDDNSSYSIITIIIYIVIIMVAFGLCVLISHKLKVYSHKTYKVKATKTTIVTEN